MDFLKSMAIAASGLRAQAGRMRVISENIANANSTAQRPGARSLPAQDPDLPLRDRPRARRADVIAMGQVRAGPDRIPLKYEPAIRPPTPTASQISERQFAGRDDRHARGAAVLRGEPQRHRRDAPHDPAHHRHAARMTGATSKELQEQSRDRWHRRSPPPTPTPSSRASPIRAPVSARPRRRSRRAELRRMLKDAIGTVVEAGKKSDGQAQAMAAGKANVVDVVTAVAETEVAIECAGLGARQGDPVLRRNHADADLSAVALARCLRPSSGRPAFAKRSAGTSG